jgi:hypothetical protein
MWFLLALSLAFAPTTSAEPSEARSVGAALTVLHDWDARREQAWAASDRARLARLYTPGSSAGRADVRLLRAYASRGLVVRRLETQVFAVHVLASGPRRIVLRVFDRVAGGAVAASAESRRLPSTLPALRDVTFERFDGVWRVSEVSARGPGPRGSRR